MNTTDTVRLPTPRQDLDQCSLFACNENAVSSWVNNLPKANIGQTTRLLFQALTELNRVRLIPVERLKITELLREQVHFASRALKKHYLNQPIVLTSQARKVANLSHTLHHLLAIAYTITANHTIALGKRISGTKPEELLATALFRAINEHTNNLIRHYQLYEPAAAHCWQQLHQLYALAEQKDVTKLAVNDIDNNTANIQSAYIRALLLGACKPNQLRQEDFEALFSPLLKWSEYCLLRPASFDSLFIINPNNDSPPLYREAYLLAVDAHWLGLDTQNLSRLIKQTLTEQTDSVVTMTNNHKLSRDLLEHVFLSWSEMSKRTFMRLENNDELNLSIGLSATHHYCSSGISFEALLETNSAPTMSVEKTNPFLKPRSHEVRQKDVWDSAYEKNFGQTNVALESIDFHISKHVQTQKEESKYRHHQVHALNASAHGYCINWPNDNRDTVIKTGEIVGVQESQSHNWNIAVIRWVSQDTTRGIQIGLELISPSASPYGARIIQKTGPQSEYSRALVLPAIPAINMPVTLLTPRVPFKEGQKISLNQQGKEIQVQLTKKLNETGAYNRFEFRKTVSFGSKTATTPSQESESNEESFDELWNNL